MSLLLEHVGVSLEASLNLAETYQEKYLYFDINPQSRIYESIKPAVACLCFRTFCVIIVKLKGVWNHRRLEGVTNKHRHVKRQRRGQGRGRERWAGTARVLLANLQTTTVNVQ